VLTGLWLSAGSPEPHVELGDWAQLIVLAPATANILGRVASGRSDDIVTATLLAARCPVVIAPAMNDAMWSKPAVQENVATLRHRGITVVEPETGHLASGHLGTGRLAGASKVLDAMADAVRSRYDLAGRRVIVSAGGTREPIDPVRFISNYSSGKMGFAIAAAAADRGAQVTLVTTANHPSHHGVEMRQVATADEMLAELRSLRAQLVFYESPQRLRDTLIDLRAALGDRPALAARELTKVHEELARGTLSQLADHFSGEVRGEVVIVVSGDAPGEEAEDPAALEEEVRRRLDQGERPKEIAEALAGAHSKRQVYQLAIRLKT